MKQLIYSGILREKTVDNKILYTPNCDKQNTSEKVWGKKDVLPLDGSKQLKRHGPIR